MTETSAPAHAETVYALHGDDAVYFLGYLDGDTAVVYEPNKMRRYEVAVAEITRPMPGQVVKLTDAQFTVACYRFYDVATDTEDFGAVLDTAARTLRITDVGGALATLDNAIDILAGNVEDGYNAVAYARELGVTRRLRAKVLAAARA